jgi:Flp pilus assembly protein TadD
VLGKVAQGQWKEAEEELRKLVEERPEDVEVRSISLSR